MTKLGQHFLKNKIKLRKIVEALDLKPGDTIIEIGPGHGELTEELRIKNAECRIIAIEKDRELASFLKEKLLQDKNIEIIEGDALKILPSLTYKLINLQTYKLVGNIPYYITGYLFRILEELENKPSKIILLVQKEVAWRLCAPKYGQKMNLLALSTQFYADVKILFYVSKGDFQPAPKIDSAVVEIVPRQTAVWRADREVFFKIIKAGFSQKRKLLSSNLANNLKIKKETTKEIMKSVGINAKSRAEDLTMENWVSIAEKLKI